LPHISIWSFDSLAHIGWKEALHAPENHIYTVTINWMHCQLKTLLYIRIKIHKIKGGRETDAKECKKLLNEPRVPLLLSKEFNLRYDLLRPWLKPRDFTGNSSGNTAIWNYSYDPNVTVIFDSVKSFSWAEIWRVGKGM
jgi:hypothetical protein